MLSASNREDPAIRKMRERMELLALPPEEAQRRISLNLTEPLVNLSAPGQDLRSELQPPIDDETLAE